MTPLTSAGTMLVSGTKRMEVPCLVDIALDQQQHGLLVLSYNFV